MRFTLFILAMSSLSLFANQNTFICRQALAKISAEVSERLKVRGVTEALPIQEMLLITSKESTQNTPGLKKQADEVAEFLSNLFVAARGNEIFLPFREVRIAESKWFGSRMSMEGDTLVIHPPISSTQLSTGNTGNSLIPLGISE
jgi:hypothetical protein